MLQFQEKRRLKSFLSSKMTLVVAIVLVIFVARGAWGVWGKEHESKANLAAADAGLAELEQRQKLLAAEVARLETSRGVEEEIRNKFQAVKPGEDVAIIVQTAATSSKEKAPPMSFWQKFLNLLK